MYGGSVFDSFGSMVGIRKSSVNMDCVLLMDSSGVNMHSGLKWRSVYAFWLLQYTPSA